MLRDNNLKFIKNELKYSNQRRSNRFETRAIK